MTTIPPVPPLTSKTPAAMLMAVLDIIESESMRSKIEDCGGVNRRDGVRPPLWEVRFKLGHAAPDNGTWMSELEHAVLHALAAGTINDLQAALRVIAAVSASWALALEVRADGDAG